MPVLNVFAKDDHIVPPATTQALKLCVGSKDYQELPLPGGHVGVFVGGKSQTLLAPGIANWLAEHDNDAPPRHVRDKVVSPDEAVAVIRDGDTVCTSGFVGIGTPDELILALERRFLAGQPSGLTLLFAAALGDGKERGLNRLAHPGLLKRVVGGHWSLIPKIGELALDNAIEAYNLPLGCISRLYREIAARRPASCPRWGFVPSSTAPGRRQDQCDTTEDLVELIEIEGETWLRYKTFPINVGSSAAPPLTRPATSPWNGRR